MSEEIKYDKTRKTVQINLSGEEKKLFFGMNAIADLEYETDKSIGEILEDETFIGSIRFLRAAIAAGLKYAKRRITPDKVGDMMQSEDLAHYSRVVIIGLVMALNGDPDTVQESFRNNEEDESTESGAKKDSSPFQPELG